MTSYELHHIMTKLQIKNKCKYSGFHVRETLQEINMSYMITEQQRHGNKATWCLPSWMLVLCNFYPFVQISSNISKSILVNAFIYIHNCVFLIHKVNLLIQSYLEQVQKEFEDILIDNSAYTSVNVCNAHLK